MPTSMSTGNGLGTAPDPPLPSHSRSREGSGGSRQPPTHAGRSRSSNTLPTWFVDNARQMLNKQREFRVDQLSRLNAASDATSDAAHVQIETTLREAAQLLVMSIDAALSRIERGSYGRCQRCGDLMSLHRLAVLPTSTLCGRCQRDRGSIGVDPAEPVAARRDG